MADRIDTPFISGKTDLTRRATAACVGVDRARGVMWIEPAATVEVQYNELMQGRLRDAVLRWCRRRAATRRRPRAGGLRGSAQESPHFS
jgi:hypothetical protein